MHYVRESAYFLGLYAKLRRFSNNSAGNLHTFAIFASKSLKTCFYAYIKFQN